MRKILEELYEYHYFDEYVLPEHLCPLRPRNVKLLKQKKSKTNKHKKEVDSRGF
jgi:hypothetical protein